MARINAEINPASMVFQIRSAASASSALNACSVSFRRRVEPQSGWVGGQVAPHGLVPMQAAWPPNRPISAQPSGQTPFRAVCGAAALAHGCAMGCAPRLASHPEKAPARWRKDTEQALRFVVV